MGTYKLSELVGAGYADFWRCKKRYRVVKGSRGSKKSVTCALWFIINLMAYPDANLLVIRRYANTLRDSCFAVLNWAVERLGVAEYWKVTKSPLEMTFIPTGQKIIFRGLDDGLKITSIAVTRGVLCWVWFEESYEIEKEEDFNRVEMSIRGQLPKGLFKQYTLTFNPWSEHTWLKKRFFDTPDDDTFVKTTTYKVNEWLYESDIRLFEKMCIENPRRYRIEGNSEWGIAEGLIYENVEKRPLSFDDFVSNPKYKAFYGLDFGFTDPTAFVMGFYDAENIYVLKELYLTGTTNQVIAKQIKKLGVTGEVVKCDADEPKSIEELRKAGINARLAVKGPDSVLFGIQQLQNFTDKAKDAEAVERVAIQQSNYLDGEVASLNLAYEETLLLQCEYTDHIDDEADEVNINLKDEDGKWAGTWLPTRGDKVKVTFTTEARGLLETKNMIIDRLSVSGRTRVFSFSAVSIPLM